MPSSQNNKITIEVYNQDLNSYLKKTPEKHQQSHNPLLRWINSTLKMIPRESVVFEVGSGTGREARYMQKHGFRVITTDASSSFVGHLRQRGHEAFLFNILEDDFPDHYDLIYANAVLPHFTLNDLLLSLMKVDKALKPNGVFAFSVKQGDGETWVNEKFHSKRFVHFWQPDEIKTIIEEAGFTIVFLESNIIGDIPAHTWINISIKKKSA